MPITYPQTVFDANTIATLLTNNWGLDGLLALAQNVVTTTTAEGVVIFPHQNPEGVAARLGIFVRKITTLENVVEHPKFDEVHDDYEIWCHYILEGIEEAMWINAESLIQQMQQEVLRILKLSFDPANGVGTFFSTDRKWSNRDDLQGNQQQLNRVLTFSLIKLRSRTTSVPVGYGFALAFDIVNSDGSGLPGSNYIYTEANRVEVEEGWDTIDEPVSPPSTLAQGVAIQFTGKFAGFATIEIFPKVADIGSSTNKLNQLYQILSSNHITGGIINEIPRIYLSITSQNTVTPIPNTLNDYIVMRPTKLRRVYDQEQLVAFRLTGKIYKPATITFT